MTLSTNNEVRGRKKQRANEENLQKMVYLRQIVLVNNLWSRSTNYKEK